jgi:hypothetical protein
MSLEMLFFSCTVPGWLDFLNSYPIVESQGIWKVASPCLLTGRKGASKQILYIVAMNKHHLNFLASGIIPIRPIETGYSSLLISRSVDQSRVADWQRRCLRWGVTWIAPFAGRQVTTHRRFFWLPSLLVVSFFNLRFFSALTILIYFLFTFFLAFEHCARSRVLTLRALPTTLLRYGF